MRLRCMQVSQGEVKINKATVSQCMIDTSYTNNFTCNLTTVLTDSQYSRNPVSQAFTSCIACHFSGWADFIGIYIIRCLPFFRMSSATVSSTVNGGGNSRVTTARFKYKKVVGWQSVLCNDLRAALKQGDSVAVRLWENSGRMMIGS